MIPKKPGVAKKIIPKNLGIAQKGTQNPGATPKKVPKIMAHPRIVTYASYPPPSPEVNATPLHTIIWAWTEWSCTILYPCEHSIKESQIVPYSHHSCLSPCPLIKIWRVRRRFTDWQGEQLHSSSYLRVRKGGSFRRSKNGRMEPCLGQAYSRQSKVFGIHTKTISLLVCWLFVFDCSLFVVRCRSFVMPRRMSLRYLLFYKHANFLRDKEAQTLEFNQVNR